LRAADGGAIPTKPIPVGRPIADTQLLILSSTGTLSGPGELGEIHVRSPYLSRGYVNDEALTRERFVTNPYTGQASDRLYRTGDLARYRPDGVIELAGRADQQIKIRGYRIEPGEIEAGLAGHPGVQDCAVVVREVGSGDKHLIAYAVGRNGQRLIPDELRTYLRKLLPDHMIPVSFVVLHGMPLTPNGKVDRRALALREDDRQQTIKGYVPPNNQIELLMTEIWSEVLNVGKVGAADDFFELGGHSLSATRLIARVQSAFGIDLPLRCLFIEPTVAGLAKYISYDAATQTYRYIGDTPRWSCLVPAQPKGTRLPLFLVMGNQSPDDTLLTLSRIFPHLGPDQPVYGFRPRWMEGDDREGYASVVEAARGHIAELRTVQPKGPYLLGGYCVDGIMALEMAQQLMQAGDEVALLALIDTERPTAVRALLANLRLTGRRTRHMLGVIFGITRMDVRSSARAVWDLLGRKLSRKFRPRKTVEVSWHFYRSKTSYRRLMYSYRPTRYPGRITLIVNERHQLFATSLGWKPVAGGGLAIHKTAGGHITMLTQHSRELAQSLLACIDDALLRHGRPSAHTGDDLP
jgi:thioesterase domain-containing protein/acyl carrier protein